MGARKLIFLVCLWIMSLGTAHAQDNAPVYRELMRIERANLRYGLGHSEHFAFNPDGTQIAAAASESNISIWNIETGDVVRQFEHSATSVSWSPNGEMIAAGNHEGLLRVWDVNNGILKYELDGYGRHTSWSPDSTQFVTNYLNIQDAETGEIILEFGPNWGIPYHAYWSPDGTMIATPSGWEGRYLNIWSTAGERLDTYWAGRWAAWSPDSTRLASTGQVRDVATGLPVTIIQQMDYEIAWHPAGEWIASTGDLGSVFLWDAVTGELVTMWQYEDCYVNGFAWSADGNRFAMNCAQAGPNYRNDLIIRERAQ